MVKKKGGKKPKIHVFTEGLLAPLGQNMILDLVSVVSTQWGKLCNHWLEPKGPIVWLHW